MALKHTIQILHMQTDKDHIHYVIHPAPTQASSCVL
ncbi:transposase [Atopobium sp. oral taxon 416]|nr:transposase [Atopobium sp. oral taxon 416]